MNIFEELDKILKSVNESEEVETAKEKAERIVKAIPVNPEMETEEQGKQKGDPHGQSRERQAVNSAKAPSCTA